MSSHRSPSLPCSILRPLRKPTKYAFAPKVYLHLLPSPLRQLILHPQILPHIPLMQHHICPRIQILTDLGRLRRDTKPERNVSHGKHNHTCILRDPLRHSPQARFDNIVAVEEAHLTLGLDPDFVGGVLGEVVEEGDADVEFLGLREGRGGSEGGREGEKEGSGLEL